MIGSAFSKIKALAFSGFGIAFVVGIMFWGGFNTVLELTNTEAFCISCHEMEKNVYQEYRNTIHYSNRTGVRATCPDCHVPKEWGPKIVRKIQASNEVFHKILGTISTPEKFNAKRAVLAQNEWNRMKKNDSQECRNCHHFDYMDYAEQGRRASSTHQLGWQQGKTCIDCHKGIAHNMPPVDQSIGIGKEGAVMDAGAIPAKTATTAAAADGKTGLDASSFGALRSAPGK
ncbi:MAG: NapC/NirT family cytochrome c [Gammaproteobacteria bacterium]|nr:cytochrome c-type protein NapC [Rhodocyclaceae bacterium]MBU3909276.1 NapC/NirT family cytochrome c [Gammaproteobacteria bacterium]MBU3989530.1 NapC/NirT family cytochrome c [Gammaproteobacteria bacterium]MBU4005564.1 NapC/NirT family cytochrome c [Gammaproteobacteria bacterium]MBU4020883.1 NapC/NirT family cytochrome c [Gammaproteobacteria bacterium]